MTLCRWTIPVAVSLCAAAALLLGLTRQGSAGVDPRNAAEIVHALPADVDAVIVVADAARLRVGGAGAALARIAAESGHFDETTIAWRNLARVLDWPADRAFDELLGRRVTVVLDGLDGEGGPRWAVLSEVSAAAERRLRERLKPAPRGIVAGLPVLAVEDGRYEMAISRRAGGSVFLLARAGDDSLFDRLVPALSGRVKGPTLGETTAMAAAAELHAGDFFILYRDPKAKPGGPEGFAALSATFDGPGFSARIVSTPGVIWAGAGADLSALRQWTADGFEELSQDAFIATMGVLGDAGDSWRAVLDGQLWMAPLGMAAQGPELARLLGTRGMFAVRPTPGPADRHRQDDKSSGEHLSVVLGLETTDTAAMAVAGDRIVASMIPFLEAGRLGDSHREPGPQYDGTMPEAVRVVTLEGEFAASMTPAFGPTPVLSWGYCYAGGCEAAPPLSIVRIGSSPETPEPRPGWWIVALSSAETPAALVGCQALGGQPPRAEAADREAPRISIGVVRPARIERWMAVIDPTFFGPLRPVRWIDSVRWDAVVQPGGTIAADIEVQLVADPRDGQ